MDGRPRRVPQADLRQDHVLGGDGTRLGGGSRAAESPTQFRSAGGACWASPGERWPLRLELRLAPALPCCGPAYGQTLAAVTRIRHVQGSPPHAARRCPTRESDRRALVAPHPHHLHRPILDLLDPPPLTWLWASGRGWAVPSGGRGSFSCRAPAGRPTAPRVFQLGPRNTGDAAAVSVLVFPTLPMRKTRPGTGCTSPARPSSWPGHVPAAFCTSAGPVASVGGRRGQSPPLLAAVPVPCRSAQACAGLAPEPALGSSLGLESEESDRVARPRGIGGGSHVLFPGATVAVAPAACLQSLAVPTDVS